MFHGDNELLYMMHVFFSQTKSYLLILNKRFGTAYSTYVDCMVDPSLQTVVLLVITVWTSTKYVENWNKYEEYIVNKSSDF